MGLVFSFFSEAAHSSSPEPKVSSHLDWIEISALIPSPPRLLPSHILCLFSRTAPKGNFCLLPPLHTPPLKSYFH